MDFRQIEAFIKVVELGSFSKAAHELHVSQPSISAYIAALEKELDAVLINRSTKVFSTTLAGERFLSYAKEMQALKLESIKTLRSLAEDISGEIRILASSVPAVYLMPTLLAGFHKQHPKITFSVSQADTSEVVRGIAAHKADIGFAGSVLGESKCEFYPFANEKLVMIAAPDSPYSEDETYRFDELLYLGNFIAREPGSGTRMQYEKFFSQCGISLNKIKTNANMDSTQSIISAVEGGLGISIVSHLAAQHKIRQKELKQIKLTQELPVRKIYAVLNKSAAHSHLVDMFMRYIGEEAERPWEKSD